MELFTYFVLYQLPYVAIPFYMVMLGVRIWVWLRFYNPALKLLPGARGSVFQIWRRQYRPTIHLFPGRPRTKGLEWVRLVKGFLFFTGLWKRDKVLWVGSWLLHFGLALYVLGHARLILPLGLQIDHVLIFVTTVGCWLMTVSGVYLLFRRVLVQRVREITDFRDYLSDLILLAFSFTALMVALDGGVSGDEAVAYLIGFFTFSQMGVDAGAWWVWHMLALQALLLVMPFSHLLHFGGIFLSRQFLGTSDSFAGEFGEKIPSKSQ
jgi:nitrate reductase gamma subunit